MIQILGLRTFVKDGQEITYDAFHDRGWRASTLTELFSDIEKHTADIPRDELWNLFYTVAECGPGKREFLRQNIIPIDIDGVEQGQESVVARLVCAALEVPKGVAGVVYSGNGVHILLPVTGYLLSKEELNGHKVHYKAMLGRIATYMFENGVMAHVGAQNAPKGALILDPTVFSASRLLRLPGTENRKPHGIRQCKLLQKIGEPMARTLQDLAGVEETVGDDAIHPRVVARFPDPDTKSVLDGCSFIQHCGTTEEYVSDEMWYAMLSITGRLDPAREISEKYSEPRFKNHPTKYKNATPEVMARELDYKIEHAVTASGPRTCANISRMWDKCKECPHWQKITSPIQIRGKDYIKTESTGFYNVELKDGVLKKTSPNYGDLKAKFVQEHDYVTEDGSRAVYITRGTHYERLLSVYIHNFAERHFDPRPKHAMCVEFENLLSRDKIIAATDMFQSGKLNFMNGWLNTKTLEFDTNREGHVFPYVIPMEFEPQAETPVWDTFISQVSLGDRAIASLIEEYLGYCMSGTHPSMVQKVAVLIGEGSNGKSVLLSLLREILGAANCASATIKALSSETGRAVLINRLVNISSEQPKGETLDSDAFKAIVSGDVITARRLYESPIEFEATTKLIFACNRMPSIGDDSYGLKRRLMLIPFDAEFSDDRGNRDPDILSKLMKERCGIVVKCLKAFHKVEQRGFVFTQSSRVKDEVDDYMESADSVGRFVKACVYRTANDEDKISTAQLYKYYAIWCEDNHVQSRSFASFNQSARAFKDFPKFRTSEARGFARIRVNLMQENY